VLIIEAMAQTAFAAAAGDSGPRAEAAVFVAIDGARFRRPVVPGAIEDRSEGDYVAGIFASWTGGYGEWELAAEATLMCKMVTGSF